MNGDKTYFMNIRFMTVSHRFRFVLICLSLIFISGQSFSAGESTLPLLAAKPEDICSEIRFRDSQGVIQQGLKNCNLKIVAPVCSSDGEVKCLADGATTKAVIVSELDPTKFLTGTTIAGVDGSSAVNCSADGGVGCITNVTYTALDSNNVLSSNIKSGVTIAGVLGEYPSASYPLSSASARDDLTSNSFNDLLKSSLSFEYWGSSGSYNLDVGEVNLTPQNIASNVVIFGVTGTNTSPSAWDLRMGSSVVSPSGIVYGKIKTNCRNSINTSVFKVASLTPINVTGPSAGTSYWTGTSVTIGAQYVLIAGAPPAGFTNGDKYYAVNVSGSLFELASTSIGPAIVASAVGSGSMQLLKVDAAGAPDYMDTIDDANDGLSGQPSQYPTAYTGWTDGQICGGLSTSLSDNLVWFDVTTTGDGVTASTCAATAAHCSYFDKISNLQVSSLAPIDYNWASALSYCDTLQYNGKTDWRLPTSKEIQSLYMHGMRSVLGGNFVPDTSNMYWTASTQSNSTALAWFSYLQDGYAASLAKSTVTNMKTICVRP
jgi:hypothetical protein